MNTRWVAVLALAAALLWVAPAMADDDKGKGKGNPHANKGMDNDDGRWEARDGYEHRTYERDARPPGWSKGKKTGWGNSSGRSSSNIPRRFT